MTGAGNRIGADWRGRAPSKWSHFVGGQASNRSVSGLAINKLGGSNRQDNSDFGLKCTLSRPPIPKDTSPNTITQPRRFLLGNSRKFLKFSEQPLRFDPR